MARIYLNKQTQQAAPKRIYLNKQQTQTSAPKQRIYLDKQQTPKKISAPKKSGLFKNSWDTFNRNLIKSSASVGNAFEDTGKTIGFGIANMIKPELKWKDVKKSHDIDFLGHQKDVFAGRNQRTLSTVMNEIADKEDNKYLRAGMRTAGYAGDFVLDPLNKVGIASKTVKGLNAAKKGKMALTAAEQAKKGQRAVLQFGKQSLLPKSIDRALFGGATKANDLIRSTSSGNKLATILSKGPGKVRPGGVSREDFKVIEDAKTAYRNLVNYTQNKSIELAKDMSKRILKLKATAEQKKMLLHAVEKGDMTLAPKGFEDIFKVGVDFKKQNEAVWKKYGGSILEGHGLSHVATKEVAEEARKTALKKGGNLVYSPKTGLDIHRQWVKMKGNEGTKVFKGERYSDLDTLPEKDGGGIFFAKRGEGMKGHGPKKLEAEMVAKKTFKANNQEDAVGKLFSEKEQNKIWEGFDDRSTAGHPEFGDEFLYLDKTIAKKLREKGYDSIHYGKVDNSFDMMSQEQFVSLDRNNIKVKNTGNKLDAPIKAIPPTPDQIVNMKEQGIKYVDDLFEKGKGGYVDKKGNLVNIEQASANEINESLLKAGGKEKFIEDLPTVAAKMGIATGRKQAGKEFLEATKGLKGPEAKAIAKETYEKMTNVEALNKAITSFDNIQNIWKSQALIAPSYHLRNIAGNLWNNYLADVRPAFYGNASVLQNKSFRGATTAAEKATVKEMEQLGVIGTGQYGGDIAETVSSELGKTSFINPLSRRFAGYKGNKYVGSMLEDNAKIAHYLSKKAEGFTAKEASLSVKKYLFDYGDLTSVEKSYFKRIMPFYTWTSKNLPLQVEQFVQKPGKFAKIAVAKKDREEGIDKPNEKYLNDYIASNSPIRLRTDPDGSTQYFLAGQWLPAATALDFLSQPPENIIGMITPFLKVPIENIMNKSSFFKDTLGEYEEIQNKPGQLKSFFGFDMKPKTINAIRSIRILNEINKWNPGEIFGNNKGKGSVWNALGIDNASNQRGSKYSPDSSQTARNIGLLVGKTSNFNEDQSKDFYDWDTKGREDTYNQQINAELKLGQIDLARKTIKEMSEFMQEREGGTNKNIEGYNLMGDQYFEDLAKNKAAELERKITREKMREMIREGLKSGNNETMMEAMKLDPTYAGSAVKDALKEQSEKDLTTAQKKMMYEVEQLKTKMKLQPFYTNE